MTGWHIKCSTFCNYFVLRHLQTPALTEAGLTHTLQHFDITKPQPALVGQLGLFKIPKSVQFSVTEAFPCFPVPET